MTAQSDPVIALIAVDLVSCLTTEMANVPNPVSNDPRPVCLRPGSRVDLLISQSADECCLGLSWVRMVRMYPSYQGRFPAPDERVTPCDVGRWAVVFELGAVRCAPTSESTDLPTCEQWTDATLDQYDDLAAIRRAICCYQNMYPNKLVYVGTAEPLTTEGGCSGITMQITIAAAACDCA